MQVPYGPLANRPAAATTRTGDAPVPLHAGPQKFVAVHSSVNNLFNQERSLSRRETFTLQRTAALAEWRQLCAA